MPTRILLAESDDVLRASLAEQLEREGYDVSAATDGDGALASAREQLALPLSALPMRERCRGQPARAGLVLSHPAADRWTRRPRALNA